MKTLAQKDSDRAAAWIPPWTGGLRVITLWDMKEYLAKRLTDIAWNLAMCQVTPVSTLEDNEWPGKLKNLKHYAKEILEECRFLGLTCTERQAVRYRTHLEAGKMKAEEIESASDELMQRFKDETDALKLFYVPNDKIIFYNRTDLFGDDFKSNFPTANSEIIEAGNCFAFDRFTACVFHLMRSLEVVLKSLFLGLGLPPLASAGSQNWNGILREIRNKLDTDKKIPDWNFYDGGYAFLVAAKNPMRNATMHVDVVYPDEGSVRPVWLATEAFMRHVATKLKESP